MILRLGLVLLGSIGQAVALAPPVPPLLQASPPARHEILHGGEKRERPLRGGDRHTYALRLRAGEYLDASIAPQDVSVTFRLRAPEPRTELLFEEQLPGGTGPKSIEWIAAEGGLYRLEAESPGAATREG